ncbi:dormancy-associated protein homolog 3 isoform X2 [Elaeis guineensis]|uniref:Dormancy-associated protein homolog 3 isoform X2 n=1 Tax=Elaeis guineensis var. tenera TaxID=51953 RepID=A0A6I9QWS5_ELAGV|nr:dormancy-associated protein homolog 3 isoform X2 [Elaeis guineensis]
MSLLDKLWDDTVAGPQPDAGLGRLRKPSSLSLRPPSARDEAAAGEGRSCGEEEEPRVTRAIMIKRPGGRPSPASWTPPSSPAGFTPPASPFAGGGGKEWNRFRRKYERRGGGGGGGEVVGVEGESTSFPPFEV